MISIIYIFNIKRIVLVCINTSGILPWKWKKCCCFCCSSSSSSGCCCRRCCWRLLCNCC